MTSFYRREKGGSEKFWISGPSAGKLPGWDRSPVGLVPFPLCHAAEMSPPHKSWTEDLD